MSAAAIPAPRRSPSRPRRNLRVIDAAGAPSPRTPLVGAAYPLPALRDGFVPRPRLVRRLIDAADVPLVIVAAPAGYGKTTLLSEWARQDERPFAWVTLDDGDDDPALLMAEVADALDARHPAVLVLDGVETLHAPESVEALRALAGSLPPGSQLVLASRTEPALPTGRLRAHRTLAEIRARDLVMTAAEAGALLTMAGLDFTPGDVDTLVRRTEGWPAALYLAAISLRDASDVPAAVERFGGDDVTVADYLRDEVLSGLDGAEIAFLRRAAVLDRLSGPVCDAVLARRGSARLLAELGRTSLLLVPLDRKGESYRCHSLFAQMLRGELRRLEPELEPELHGRASDWHAAHGDVERAIEHAIAAGDTARAGDLLWASAPEYVTRGRSRTMLRWLSRFTNDQISAHPALALAAANSHLVRGELDAVQRWESAACRALRGAPPGERTAALEAGVAILRAALARDGVVRMGADAASAYELEREDSPWRAICCLLAGVAHHLTGHRERARGSLEEGVRRAAVAAPNVQTLCLAQLALLAVEQDDWQGAAVLAARARAQVDNHGLGDYPTSALVFAVSSLARTRRGRVEEAQGDLRQATRLLEALTDFVPWYEVETRVALARAALRLGDVVGARELLADAARQAQRTPEAIVLREWIEDAEAQAAEVSDAAVLAPSSLTTAELRVLGFLPTHLSFREIAARLHVSANTVKTQAHAVYRKLDASSRSEAVARATGLGLLGDEGWLPT